MRFLGSFFACMDRSDKKPLIVFNFYLYHHLFYISISNLDVVKVKSEWLNNVKLHFSVN
jgi:hypothetical protein